MEETGKLNNKLLNQEIDYFKIAKILVSRWYWIVGSVIICMIFARVYLWYTPKIYATSGSMKFEEKRSPIPEVASLTGGADKSSAAKIQSETLVLQSTPLLLNAIKQLDYRISFFIVGRILNRTSELYPQKPLDVRLIEFDSLNFFHDLITFKPINRNTFTIRFKTGVSTVSRICHYNVPFTVGPTSFSIMYPGDLPSTTAYLFKLNAPEDFVGRVRGGFRTGEAAKNSNIISLQETDSNPQFAADILNAIMKEYLNYDRAQKTLSATQTIQFINSQLAFLSGEVKGSENSIKQFKESKKIMDVSTASEQALNKVKDIEQNVNTLKVQLISIDQAKEQIIKAKDSLNINFSVGDDLVDPALAGLISNLNTLLIERNGLLRTYINNSQPVNDINKQILTVKNNALNSINITRKLFENKIKYFSDQLKPIDEQLAELPTTESDLGSLKRAFEINDKVYSFLSEKKLDAQISSAGILPGATILDEAQPNYSPVYPDDASVRRTALIFGLVIGLGAIILIRILNPYIYDKETIEALTSIPIIGVISRYPEEIDEYSSQILAVSRPKSIFAESVRSVRTNLNFLAGGKKNKVICITSEVAGEGKSFVAVNLSSTLSLIDKKVILIGADLRRSKLHRTFKTANDCGLSNYLANQCEAADVIQHSEQNHFDFITSGPVPPNPSELLHSDRMRILIDELKVTYDVIMIDTAPIGLVSDAVPIIRQSDINVFVIRSGKSKYFAATVPQRIAQEYQLDNTVIVLNAYEQDLLHSRYYTTKFTGDSVGGKHYYYSDYTGYDGAGYYTDQTEFKWWNWRHWFKR